MQTIKTKNLRYKGLTRKHNVFVTVTDKPVETFGTWWDGGSKAEYEVFDLISQERDPVNCNQNGAFDNRPASTIVEPIVGKAVLKTGMFCGKPAIPHLYLWNHGDTTLGNLLLGFIQGEVPWNIVCDRYKDLSLM